MPRIGPKGQMVIEKALRQQLGIGPGWHAVQEVRGNELVVRFQPPLHTRSLAGALRRYAKGIKPPSDEVMDKAVERAIVEEWQEQEATGGFDE